MEERKIEVIRVAIRLFSEKGYNSTSVEEIAKESGMAKGSFYKYFSSKEDLLLNIFTLIPKQIKKGLTKIYSKEYQSDQEKLVDFISMLIENILSNQVHLLMAMVFDLPLVKNKEMAQEAERTEIKIMTWNREFLLDLYGDEMEDYIWDLIFLLRGFIFQYVRTCRHQEPVVDIKKSAVFIAAILDIVVKGLIERKPEPVLDLEVLGWNIQTGDESPRLKGQKIQLLLRKMEYTVKNLKIDPDVQDEYLQTLSLLGEEGARKKTKRFLIKALINYLQKVPELKEDCEILKIMLEV